MSRFLLIFVVNSVLLGKILLVQPNKLDPETQLYLDLTKKVSSSVKHLAGEDINFLVTGSNVEQVESDDSDSDSSENDIYLDDSSSSDQVAELYKHNFIVEPPSSESVIIDDEDDDDDLDLDKISYFENVNGVSCRKCPPGTGLVSMCNRTHQTTCEPCVSGSNYSDGTPHFRPCSPCSRCGPGMYVEVLCTEETDTFCDWCHHGDEKKKNLYSRARSNNEDFLAKCQHDETVDVSNSIEISKPDSTGSNELSIFRRLVPSIGNKITDDKKSTGDHGKKSIIIDRLRQFQQKQPLIAVDRVEQLGNDNILKKEKDSNLSWLKNSDFDVDKSSENNNKQSSPIKLADLLTELGKNQRDDNANKKNDDDYSGGLNNVIVFDPDADSLDKTMKEVSITAESPLEKYLQRKYVAGWLLQPQDNPENQDIVFKPSVHSYPYDDLIHSSSSSLYEKTKLKVIKAQFLSAFLFCLVCFLCLLVIFKCCRICCFAAKRNDKLSTSTFIVSALTDDDNKVIKDCAIKMENDERMDIEQQQQRRKRDNRIRRYNPFRVDNDEFEDIDDHGQDGDVINNDVNVMENPLIRYLEQEKTTITNGVTCSAEECNYPNDGDDKNHRMQNDVIL